MILKACPSWKMLLRLHYTVTVLPTVLSSLQPRADETLINRVLRCKWIKVCITEVFPSTTVWMQTAGWKLHGWPRRMPWWAMPACRQAMLPHMPRDTWLVNLSVVISTMPLVISCLTITENWLPLAWLAMTTWTGRMPSNARDTVRNTIFPPPLRERNTTCILP